MQAILEIISALTITLKEFLRKKRDDDLIDQGRQLERGKNAEKGLDNVIKANEARDRARRDFEHNGVSKDDKYARANKTDE